jgi:hypothetical protein
MPQYEWVTASKLIDFLIKLIVKDLNFWDIFLYQLLLFRWKQFSLFNEFFFSVKELNWNALLKFAQDGVAMVELVIKGTGLNEKFTLSVYAEKRNK